MICLRAGCRPDNPAPMAVISPVATTTEPSQGPEEGLQGPKEAEDTTLLAITPAVIAAPVGLRVRRGKTCTAAHRLAPMRRDVTMVVIVAWRIRGLSGFAGM